MKAKVISLIAVVSAVWVVSVDGRGTIQSRSATLTNGAGVETARIQRHLARVEQELLSKDVSLLTPPQQRARREEIRRLHAYWLAGRFPHNHDFPGRRVPYFTDQHGTLCAMAYLIATSGGCDLVDQVTRTANNAKVFELAASPVLGPALASWLEAAGLTVEEAQRIQPTYYYGPDPETEITTGYGVASGATGVLNIASVIVNGSATESGGRRQWIAFAGLATGSAEVMLGRAKVDKEPPAKTLGVVNIMVGASSIVASVCALLRSPERKLAAVRNSTARLAVTPMAGVDRAMCPVIGIRAAF